MACLQFVKLEKASAELAVDPQSDLAAASDSFVSLHRMLIAQRWDVELQVGIGAPAGNRQVVLSVLSA